MGFKWSKKMLGDIIEFNPRESIKKNTVARKIPMEALTPFQRKIESWTYEEFKGGVKFRNFDTIMARITPSLENGKTSFVTMLDKDEVAFGSTEYFILRAKEEFIDPKFLYYLAISRDIRERAIQSMTGTSGRQRAQKEAILEYELFLPSLGEQKEIVRILDKIDSKIELNNETITTLEELAATLFKHWFVDFEFPDENGNPYKSSEGKMVESELGEMPSAWRIAPLSEVGDIIAGGTPSKKIADYYEEGTIPWITPKDLSNNKSTFISEGATNITKLGLDKSSAKLLPEYSVLFSSRAPIGYVAINKNPVSTNQGFKSVVPNENIPYQFIYFYLKNNTSYIESIAGGSTFKEISGKAMKELSVILPTQDLLDQFRLTTQPIFDGIKNLEESNDTLTKLRDTLLPKLLSGEIELPMEEEVRV